MRFWILAALLAGSTVSAAPMGYSEEMEAWRAQRVENLRRPNGWLSLVGLHWIEPGTHTLGQATDNGIVLATGPQQLGRLRFENGKWHFLAAEDATVRVQGVPIADEIELRSDRQGVPTVLEFSGGAASLQVIERGGRYALRVRDANAASRSGFTGLEYYPLDSNWRLEARFEPHPPGKTIPIVNVLGQTEHMANPGMVVFERDGSEFRLEAVDEGDGRLFLIFADRTNGRESYGAGRFLYADPAQQGRTVVDFNRAYNPPCAFNAYSTCPLPPPENRLDLAVTAGEKKYRGPAH